MHVSLFILILCVYRCGFAWSLDIFEAVSSDSAQAIQEVVAKGPSSLLNKKGPGGQTPLMNAVLSGKKNAVEALLQAGADVNIPEQDGYTPMHGAGFQGRAEIAQMLINHGIPVSQPHKDGYLPFHRACWGKDSRHTETVKVFLDAGVAVNVPAENGKTCLDMTQNKATKKLLKKYMKNAEL